MYQRLIYASKGVVEEAYRHASIKLLAKDDYFCEGYALGKATNELGKEALKQGNKPFGFVRVDLAIYKNASYLGYKYSLYIIDV